MAHFARMVDMAKTPAEIKKEIKENQPAIANPDASVPVYPYGLCITLTEEQLDKLDIDGDCEVGDMIHLCAMARVTSCEEREKETGNGEKKKTCRIELQITHLATENEDEEGDAAEAGEAQRREHAQRRYGDGEGEKAKDAGDVGEMHLKEKDYA